MIITGFSAILEKIYIGAITLLVLGIVILPPISDKLKKYFNFWQTKEIRYAAYVVILFVGLVTSNKYSNKANREAKNVVSASNKSIYKVKIDESIYLEKLNDSLDLILQPNNLSVCIIAKNISNLELLSIKEADRKYPNFDAPHHGNLVEKLQISKTDSYCLKNKINKDLYNKMTILFSDCLEDEHLQRIENLKKKKTAQKERKRKVDKCYEAACSIVPDKIKASLHNPSSFEKVSCEYLGVDGNTFSIKVTYRGENAFKAIRTETSIAIIDYDTCNLVKIK